MRIIDCWTNGTVAALRMEFAGAKAPSASQTAHRLVAVLASTNTAASRLISSSARSEQVSIDEKSPRQLRR